MSIRHQIIHIHVEAAPKPTPGEPCNGCGVCCLLAPCPLGMVLSARRSGACVALHWDGESRQYRCGALVASNTVLRRVLPVALRGLSPWLAPALARLAQRWIAVGHGCDSTVELADQERSGAA